MGTASGPPKGPAGLGQALSGGQVITGVTPHRIIHFTFDDGPDPRNTPRLLDRLDQAGVKATFFFSASRFTGQNRRHAQAPALAREVLRRGHHVGSHSVRHQRMARLRPSALRQELDASERLFGAVFGANTALFRPPFGSRNRALDRMLGERGYTTVMWNLGLADWVQRPPQDLLQTFIKVQAREARRGSPGGVVLMHDSHAWTVEAFELIHAHLQARNCELLAQGGELFEVVDDLRDFLVPAPRHGAAADAPPARVPAGALAARQARLRARARERCGGPERGNASPPPGGGV